jgi:hypothetical protein
LFVGEKWRVLAGTSLVLPTGKYGADPKPDTGTGNFRTLRPALQLTYLPASRVALGAKLSLGINSRNRDNQLRSGNWFGVELAAGYKTPVGVVCVHALRVQQYQDDQGNPFGPSRFRSTNAGAFFTAVVPGLDAVLTLQYIDTVSSRHAKHGSFTQLRLIKLLSGIVTVCPKPSRPSDNRRGRISSGRPCRKDGSCPRRNTWRTARRSIRAG